MLPIGDCFFSFYQDTSAMKRDTASTRRMQKRKAAKVEGTTKDKMKKTEEETVERLVVWLFLDIICVYYLILLKTNVFQDFLFNNNTFCLK